MTTPQPGDLVDVHIRGAKVDEILVDGNISIRIGDGSYIWIGEAPDITITVTRPAPERRNHMPTYYISYQCTKEDEEGKTFSGFGSTMFAGPMGTKEHVLGAANAIKNYLDAQSVVIINWVELPDEPETIPTVTPNEEAAADELGELGRELASAE